MDVLNELGREMTDTNASPVLLVEGGVVRHPSFGLGKIVQLSTDEAYVYFPQSDDSSLAARVKRFRLPTDFLTTTQERASDLDYLPAWRDGKFVGAPTNLSMAGACQTFLRHFPTGLDDARFLSQEVAYKRSAHDRWSQSLPSLKAAITAGDTDRISSFIDEVYGNRQSHSEVDIRLNVLFQRVDEPAFFEALRAGQSATVEFAAAAVEFVDSSNAQTFQRLASALGSLTNKSGKPLEGWTMLSWLPFVADPRRQFLIKPTIVQKFASSVPFDIRYRSDLNFDTYSRCVAMAQQLSGWLTVSDLNPTRRELDLIDVQSFMWVVERYLPGD